MYWLNPLDPKVRAAVISGAWGQTPHSDHWATPPTDPDEIDVVADALDQAGSILLNRTAGVIHPALQVAEDFVGRPGTDRLPLSVQPVREIAELWAVTDDGTPSVSLEDFVLFAGNLRFVAADTAAGQWPGSWMDLDRIWLKRLACGCPGLQRLRVLYNAGSTVDARARAMVLALAHELYLQVAPCEECGSCRLPMRTTSVTREGISFNVGDAGLSPAQAGATGLPEVDLWIKQVNPYRVNRAPAVYSPEAPPGVSLALVSAIPTWSTIPTSTAPMSVTVTAAGVVS